MKNGIRIVAPGALALASLLQGCAGTAQQAGSQLTGHVLVVDTSQQLLPPRGISIYSTEQACMDGMQQRMDFLASKGVHKADKAKDESGDKNVLRLTYPDGTWTRFTCSFADGKLLSGNAPAN